MKQALAVVIAALVVTLGAVAVLADRGGGGGDGEREPFRFSSTTTLTPEQAEARAAADTWKSGISAALAPLDELAGRYATDVQSWRDGLVPDETFRASLQQWKTDVTAVRINVEALEPLASAPHAHPGYVALAAFYDASIEASLAAVGLPAGELRDQTALLATRLRVLGDRAFARGEAAYAAAAFREPEPVEGDRLPDWATDGFAAGPPLDDDPAPPASLDEVDESITQPRQEWLAAVAGAGAPSADDVLAAVRDGDPAALADVAARLDDAAAQLRVAPDPEGADGAEESARVRLGWMGLAEVARLGHVAALADDPVMTESLRFAAASLHAIIAVPSFTPAP